MNLKKPRVYVDFNEMVTEGIVLLSKEESKISETGERITFHEGMKLGVFMDDVNEYEHPDRLIADGRVINYDLSDYPEWAHVKWCLAIDEQGIYHESEKKVHR